ncbi:MAG: hypothetical protein KF724_03850 [Phycisphaeraceae bacterium]|nr:hypothetical protein [Phycisphaeraceae bacterium]
MFRPVVLIVAAVIVLALVLFNTTFTVNFHEVAIVTRFGKPAGIVREPGLHLKAPFFIDSVAKLDTRLQLIESPLETVNTRDGQQILVKAFLFWRIDDSGEAPREFYNSYTSLDGASRQLTGLLQGSLRQVGSYNFSDLIGRNSKLPEAESAILADLRRNPIAGITPEKVAIAQVVLPPKTTTAVLRRMGATQESLASLEASRANSQADSLKSQAASQADIIRDLVRLWGAEIQAQGDREASRFYREMQQHADLAIFLAWLDTLRTSLTGSTTFVTDMSRAPFQLLDPDAPTDAQGIPQPTRDAGGRPIRPQSDSTRMSPRPAAAASGGAGGS